MEHVYCVECGQMIPTQRLKALPDTRTCVKCSREVALTEADVDLDGTDSEDLIHQCQNAKEQS